MMKIHAEPLKLHINGMDCEGCTGGIENLLKMSELAGRGKS